MNGESKLGEEKGKQSLPQGFGKLMGERHYSSHAHWVWKETEGELRLVPRKCPLISHLLVCLVLLPGLCWGGYLALQGRSKVSDGFLQGIFTGLPVLVVLVFLVFYWMQLRAGPWIVISRKRHELKLPRAQVLLSLQAVHSLQVLGGLIGQASADPVRVHEVNLIAQEQNEETATPQLQRYGVLGVIDATADQAVAERLREELGLAAQ